MQITRSSTDTMKAPADWFTGDVYVDAVAAPVGQCRREGGPIETIRSGDRVFFEPGCLRRHRVPGVPAHRPTTTTAKRTRSTTPT